MKSSFTKALVLSISVFSLLIACNHVIPSSNSIDAELDASQTVGPYSESVGTNFGFSASYNYFLDKNSALSGTISYSKYGLKELSPVIEEESYSSYGISAGYKLYNPDIVHFSDNPSFSTNINYGVKVGYVNVMDTYSVPGIGTIEESEAKFSFAPIIGIDQKLSPNLGVYADLSWINLVAGGSEPFSYIQLGFGVKYYIGM